jgi:hypothetical protein
MLNRNSTPILGALLCASLMFVASPATSQSFYGSLVSVVQDAQGGVIPAVTIVLTNTATSERREGVSAENGEYRFVNLMPGTYRLEVEPSGFQRYVRDQIEVNVQSQPLIEVALQVGTRDTCARLCATRSTRLRRKPCETPSGTRRPGRWRSRSGTTAMSSDCA